MKLFNWVQRRFNHTSFTDEHKVELKQVALVDSFDGILTIGTLGFDPSKPFNQHKEYIVLEEEEIDHLSDEEHDHSDTDDDDHSNVNGYDAAVEEEENPLIFTRFEHTFDKFDEKMGSNSNGEDDDLPREEKGERITLAELFMADSEMKKEQLEFVEIVDQITNKKIAKKPSKNGLSFAKKLIPHVGEDSRPIKKIHQLMKRMLKRKIHPDVEGKGNQSKVETSQASFTKGNELIEAVSLLPTRSAAGTIV
ncbi:Protein TILLER ANGLE CONTROL 1 [Euphorbia peplus]|nr:Protein TILLER ANGLE CONTROL 1 [Euphorbia peplus]